MMMEEGYLWKKKGQDDDHFTKLIFSWSLADILNEHLYKYQVEKIPISFQSEEHYFGSFVFPLLEETHAQLASSLEIMHKAPFAEVFSVSVAKGRRNTFYDITVGSWKNKYGKEPCRLLPGDLLILVDRKPSVSDLQGVGRTWAFTLVYHVPDGMNEDTTVARFKAEASQQIEFQEGMVVILLMNITTQKRIWNSLHKNGNQDIIKDVLSSDSVVNEKCDICSFGWSSSLDVKFEHRLLSKLNEFQRTAVMSSLSKIECFHKSSVERIWGPPGTGKTETVSVMLLILLQMNCRTHFCAPTNVAVVQVASRLLNFVRESFVTRTANDVSFCCVGDVLLFGNTDKIKLSSEIEDIHVDHRVKRLTGCFSGWKNCMISMIDLLENCVSHYHVAVEDELRKVKPFLKFLRDRFTSAAQPLRSCIVELTTHIPRAFLREDNFQNMVSLLDNLTSLESLLFQANLVSEKLEQLFSFKPHQDEFPKFVDKSSIKSVRMMSCSILKTLLKSLDELGFPNTSAVTEFCFEKASLILCTTSNSYKLHSMKMKPLNLLVIDEAAQLKEAESTIPLQLPGLKQVILIGDECQLPATVKSNISAECGFGRSLYERLSSLGHSKHLLSVQYRMHPSISFFPNWKFYDNQILDAENVICVSHEKRYLSGPMFGSYSFINVAGGREEKDDDGQSRRNMLEVALVIKIVQNLYRAYCKSKKKLSIGVVSPYEAQVVSIKNRLAHKYEKLDGFSVKAKTIDGFQGGEEDVIILSTVRSNSRGSVGFISSFQRMNVALTRARHCLWILGNKRTLVDSESLWKDLVCDAEKRHCLFDADADESLKMTVVAVKKELEELDDLVNGNSVLFKNAKWKVLFSDDFKRSFGKLTCTRLKKLVLNLLLKLSGGWRPKSRSVDLCCENSSQILKQFKVRCLYVICTVDIIKESEYIQVLKVWNILPLEEIPKLTQRLEKIFSAYTDEYINRCTTKCFDGNLEIPSSWDTSQEITQFRKLGNCKSKVTDDLCTEPGDDRYYVENSKVSESLLLMKFYSLSSGVVNHLLSGKEVDLPMHVTDEQMDIISFSKSSFIIGRSGTGKTTILTMKLYQNEQSFRAACDGIYEVESKGIEVSEVNEGLPRSKASFLRQLFVTVSPKLCYAVKQHVSHLTSNGNSSAEINLDDVDVTKFNDVLETFIDIPERSYPLVLTFHKFLMMLDGTLGNSFFKRFHEGSHDKDIISSKSVALQTFIRSKEVTFDRFCSLYWPRFNSFLTKKLDPSRVFTEIISHIKGGLQAGDGKLSYEGYSSLAKGRWSTLTEQNRETIYSIFQAYEKIKTNRGEFDLGDLVNDLHRRLRNGNYKGDQMDFVYIDEVQDLSMRQISLFKYICQNVDEGFVFAGDTAQTIARGIDFRFQDIRSLFYKEFLTEKQAKGLVSHIFQLKQNFRTHAGVLDLAQSVIDILYCYFSHSVDILEPEISLISGEAPVLLDDENAIVTIFGGRGRGSGGAMAGFGAEQVILVRDDNAKTEVCEYVGKHALVLTILECKGLEFQDVLLYNFFGTSPLKDQWRVIYGYMKEQTWFDEKTIQSFPSFSESRHNILCSDLKQLYVAITRTRQRLWICENEEELSKPMFDYWIMRGLVQARKLDGALAQSMRVASSRQEWRDRGKKLFYEKNFAMATMCFERAGDAMWEKLAKASGLRASADKMRGTNYEAFSSCLREAAGLFESIGRLEDAAACYCDLREYKRAGKTYLYCEKINAAAECFTLARCYLDAAEAYAKGEQYFNCLSVCKKGELFSKGLQFIEHWRDDVSVRREEIEHTEKEFLESSAMIYHKRKDTKSMMKFVRAFCSMESKRVFLRSLGCLDDLLLLEEESGNFLSAAELARSWGDVVKEADLLGKAGNFVGAAMLLLWFVFSNLLWGNRNKGWPLKQFDQKEELCKKAILLAKNDSDIFFGFVCSELNVLSDQQSTLPELKKHLEASRQHESLRGEILSIRKILDTHLHMTLSKYVWEDELPTDINKHCEDKISQNRASVTTLVFYWNTWQEKVVDIFSSLASFHNEEPKEQAYVDFSLNYFGVRKQCVNDTMLYLLINKDAEWLRYVGHKGDRDRTGKILTLDGKQLVFAIRSYWQAELLNVSLKVLESLQQLYKSISKGCAFHQSTSLLHIFEVSRFLLNCEYLNAKLHYSKLQELLRISTTYFDLVFPLDWRRSVSENLISLTETDLSFKLLENIILQNVDIKGSLTYATIGRVAMICLSSKKPVALYEMIIRGLKWNPSWRLFFEKLWKYGLNDVCVTRALQNALEDTYEAEWRRSNYISPHSFVYLLDRLLFMSSFSSGEFFTSRSSFIGSFTHLQFTSASHDFSEFDLRSLVDMVQEILYSKEDTVSWIQKSNINPNYYHPLLVLKLVIILCLICLRVSDCSQVLLGLLIGSNNISYLLPKKFVFDLLSKRDGYNLNLNVDIVANAFISVGDPLVIVGWENAASPRIYAPCAIFVDRNRSREDIMHELFQKPSDNDGWRMISESPSSIAPNAFVNVNPVDLCTDEPQMNWEILEDLSESINGKKRLGSSIAATLKTELDKNIDALATALADGQSSVGENTKLAREANCAFDEMKLLSSAFDMSGCKIERSVFTSDETKTLQAVLERLQSSRPMVDDFLKIMSSVRNRKICKE